MKHLREIILVVVILAAALFGLVFWATRGVSAGADTFFAALEAGNVDAAYALTSTGFKGATTAEQWTEFARIYDLHTVTTHEWTSWSVKLVGKGNVSGTITRKDNTVWDTTVDLKKEEGVWKVEYFHIDLQTGAETTASDL